MKPPPWPTALQHAEGINFSIQYYLCMTPADKKEQRLEFIPGDTARLFLLSFLFLFFELVCIRWLPSYIRYLSYFTNFILMACFLGMGTGLLASRRKIELARFFPCVLLLLTVLVFFEKFELNLTASDVIYFGDGGTGYKPVESYHILPLVFIFVMAMSAMLTQEIGVLFGRLKPLEAYTLNIGGSMMGILAFSLMSFAGLPPLWWFLMTTLLFLALHRGSPGGFILSSVLMGCVCILAMTLQKDTIWSPYYRINVSEDSGMYMINVNNIQCQVMMPIEKQRGFYMAPYSVFRNNHYRKALIIGAGSGTDTSCALYHGVEDITAVEIDPVIVRLGQKLHPMKPYSDPRVRIVIDDARAFLRNSSETYDLIVYALPDSLTLTSSFANLRLESYLFTVECFREVKRHLSPDGILIMYNFYREDWLVDKISQMLADAFGYPPAVLKYSSKARAAIYLIGGRLSQLEMKIPMARVDGSLKPATDDWPFIYLKTPGIKPIFLYSLLLISIIALIGVAVAPPGGAPRRLSGHFFFLGAAFMLLETTSVVKFSLLFGSTWLVNSLVFFSILFMVLLAIWVTQKIQIRRVWILYLPLFGIIALNYLLPLETLLAGNATLRYIFSSLLLFSPIFIANLIFTQTFREEEGTAAAALASNVLGSFLGGIFEYASLLFGYRSLMIFVAIFYGGSFFSLSRAVKARGEEAGSLPQGS